MLQLKVFELLQYKQNLVAAVKRKYYIFLINYKLISL